MRIRSFVILCFFCLHALQSQHKIEGILKGADKSLTWAILYQVKGEKLYFVQNTKIKQQKFTFIVPETIPKGMYRIVYRTKGRGYIDFILNQENVRFSFYPNDSEGTGVFEVSKENSLYQNYLTAMLSVQYQIDSLQTVYFRVRSQASEKAYKQTLENLKKVQDRFEKESKGMVAYHFIKASQRFNMETIVENPQTYMQSIKNHFFEHIDFENSTLQASPFLMDRTRDFVFHINYSQRREIQERLYMEAIDYVLKLPKLATLKRDLIEVLITDFLSLEEVGMVKYLLQEHFSLLAVQLQDKDFKKEILAKLALSIGGMAPEIEWEEKGVKKQLSKLNTEKRTLVVFWSTGCSHCQRELPELYQYLKSKKNIAVVAVALEENPKKWKKIVKNFIGWHHVLGLEKWENKIARSFDVVGTPAYFLLNTEKRILAKPAKIKDLVRELEKTNL
jgi:thiol-disulfide isomerase/thioredoxin